METRACNKLTHPGSILKTAQRRTPAEVQQEHDVNAKVKASRENAKKKSIVCTAEFEHSDRLNEEAGAATPRPLFTPKPWPHRNSKKPVSIMQSDTESALSEDLSAPTPSENLATEDDSAAEGADPPPQKQKAKVTEKPTGKVGATSNTGKTADKRKRDEEMISTDELEEETPRRR